MNFLNQVLNYSPIFVLPAVLFLAVWFVLSKRNFWSLIWVMVGFHFVLALVKSILQYWVWGQSSLTRSLLDLPLEAGLPGWFVNLPVFTKFSHGYYLFYAWNHFWKEALLSILVAFIVYGVFRILLKINFGSFEKRDGELALLTVLLVGWPQAVLFLPLTLLLAVIFSIARWIYKREAFVSLVWPLIISTALVLIFSNELNNWRFLLFNF